MLFEPATIIISAVLTIMMVGVTLAVLIRNAQHGSNAASWWVVGFLTTAVGFICFSVPSTPQSFLRISMNISFLTGYACAINGARALAGRRPIYWHLAIAILLWPCFVLGLNPNFEARSMLFSMLVLAYSAACAWEFYDGAKPYERSRRFAAIVCSIHAAFYCARTIMGPTLLMAENGDAEVIRLWGALIALEALPFTALLAILVISISHEQVSHREQSIANTDYLTGIGNRRAFEKAVLNYHADKQHGRKPYLLLLDLDYFKQVNDRLGHQVGDQLLCQFVALMQQELPQPQNFWRLGGDEFAALVDILSEAEIESLARKLRHVVETDANLASIRKDVPISASIGIAPITEKAKLTQILRTADAALYEDKFLHRNLEIQSQSQTQSHHHSRIRSLT